MDKKDIQKRVLQNGKLLDLKKFEWDEKTKVFSTSEDNLVIDFSDVNSCTFKTGSDCNFNAGSYCTFKTGISCTFKTGISCTFDTSSDCTFKTGSHCTFDTGSHCTFDTSSDCTFKTGISCTFDTSSDCTFKTGYNCTFKTGSHCTFDTSSDCTFKTGISCTFDTSSDCTFKTGYNCTFKTGYNCTFDTSSHCTFDTSSDCNFNAGYNCTFKTGYNCVIVNRNIFEVILPKKGDVIQICPHKIKGHLINGLYNGKPHIIADGILSKIISKKGNVYKVINHGKSETSYLIENEIDNKKVYSHGATIKEARESLIYKLSNRDTSKYKELNLNSILSKDEAIQCYMTITGACGAGTKYFIDNLDKVKKEYSIKEIIDITESQFGNEKFKEFFKK